MVFLVGCRSQGDKRVPSGGVSVVGARDTVCLVSGDADGDEVLHPEQSTSLNCITA